MAKQQPNVIFFFTDQQRFDMAGVHGCPLDLMPNFDRSARLGTHLFHSFTCQPVCGPARSSLQTGLYATNTQCFRNAIALEPHHKTLAHYFKEAGYHTGYIGKWHLAPHDMQAVSELYQGGYDDWLGANALEMCSDAYDAVVYDKSGRQVKLPGYRVDALTDAAIRFVDNHQEEPFFLFISYLEPHFQNHRDDYPAPDGYEERYRGRWLPPDLATLGGSAHRHTPGYYGMIKRLDEAYGRLLDALRSLDLLDDTIVVFTSDHGNHFKTRNSEYKRSCHDSSLRLPTVITGPGFMQVGELRQLTSLIDLPPTVLDAAGIAVPEVMEGHSIMPLIRREPVAWQDSIFAQISEAQVGRCVRTHRWKFSVVAKDKDPGKDPASDTYEEEFLYDLMADPYELNNLLGLESHQKVAEVMRGRLLQWIEQVEGFRPEIITAPIRPSFQYRVSEKECYQ